MAYLVIKSAVVSHRKSSLATIFYIVQKIQHRRKPAMKQEKKFKRSLEVSLLCQKYSQSSAHDVEVDSFNELPANSAVV